MLEPSRPHVPKNEGWSSRGGHTPICLDITCDNGVINWRVFMCFRVFFSSLFLDKKLPGGIFQHPIFTYN